MKPISNIAYQIQYLTIFFILGLQENIYKQVKKTYYMLAGFAGQHVVSFACPTFEPCSSCECESKKLSELCMVEERATKCTINCLSRHRLGEKDPEFIRLYLS